LIRRDSLQDGRLFARKVRVDWGDPPDRPSRRVGGRADLPVRQDLSRSERLVAGTEGALIRELDAIGARAHENPTPPRGVLPEIGNHSTIAVQFDLSSWFLSLRRCSRATSTQSFSEGSEPANWM